METNCYKKWIEERKLQYCKQSRYRGEDFDCADEDDIPTVEDEIEYEIKYELEDEVEDLLLKLLDSNIL